MRILTTQILSSLVLVASLMTGCSSSESFLDKTYVPVEPIEVGPVPEKVYTLAEVDEQAQPEGGLPALQPRIVYPENAKRAGVGGTVLVRFITNERGEVVRTEVAESVHPVLDRAAMDAILHHKFTPAKKDSRPVAMVLEMPISFRVRR